MYLDRSGRSGIRQENNEKSKARIMPLSEIGYPWGDPQNDLNDRAGEICFRKSRQRFTEPLYSQAPAEHLEHPVGRACRP